MTLVFLAATGPAIESLKQPDEFDEDEDFEEDDTNLSIPELH